MSPGHVSKLNVHEQGRRNKGWGRGVEEEACDTSITSITFSNVNFLPSNVFLTFFSF